MRLKYCLPNRPIGVPETQNQPREPHFVPFGPIFIKTAPLNDLTPLIPPAMPYDPNEPQNGQSLDADALRVQLQGLFEPITSIVSISLSFCAPV